MTVGPTRSRRVFWIGGSHWSTRTASAAAHWLDAAVVHCGRVEALAWMEGGRSRGFAEEAETDVMSR